MSSEVRSSTGHQKTRYVSGLIITIFIGLCAGQILMRFLEEWVAVHQITIGTTNGEPAWRAWQNRLLGPYILLGAEYIGLRGAKSVQLLTFATFTIGIALSYILAFRITRNAVNSVAFAGCFSALYLFLQDRALFLWDTLDVIFFSLFAFAVLRRANLIWIVLLAALATINRESGLFMALYIVLGAFDFSSAHKLRIYLIDKIKFAVGIATMLVCIAYTKLSRDLLFVQTIGGGNDAKHELIGNHLQLTRNLRDLLKNNWTNEDALHTILIAVAVTYLILIYVQADAFIKSYVLLVVAMLGGIISFGVVNEPRVFLSSMPLFLFLFLHQRFSRTYS